MFPWLAHGHIFPYLELAKRIIKRKNLYIYFCSTSINFSSIKNFIDKNFLNNSIEIVEIHLKPSPELPPHYHTTKNLPSNLNFTLLKAFQTSSSSFSDIVSILKPDLVIYDIFQPWAAKIASLQGIPAVHFAAFGAATMSFIYHYYSSFDAKFPFQELCLKDHEKKSIDKLIDFLYANVFGNEKDVLFMNFKLSCDVVLLKTSEGFEGKYIDYVTNVCKKVILPVGPLVSDASEIDEESSEILKWLSTKNKYSTLYISFGSEYFLSKDEIEEIAKGLELCGVNFIWVIRFPIGKTVNIEEALPRGFLERVKERGKIVEGWAPQANILAHESTGCFMSHCGWSSINESVYFGVPVIGMPMKLNMFIDARMLGDAGACVEVIRNENEVYKGKEIAEAINKVIFEKNGEEFRRRARELSEKMKIEEEQALDETSEHLWRLCLKNK
ncbi:hypothetical protein RD792_017171 [Penstemon davidsonii]|uniref:Glycosyltransferase n=1 Tax=Penstemon davidsonii TaxID=160366 RepID=A0ABR0CN69_9LAMI|nr:hypothetical protein RD792_017171 [Penstemon davidsonii]